MRLVEFLNEITGQLRTTKVMIRNAKGNKSQVIVNISPEDFLALTTDEETIKYIKMSAQPLHKYNQYAKLEDNPEYKKARELATGEEQFGVVVHPFLRIMVGPDAKDGKVVAHEGRHRAAALLKKNGPNMTIALQLRPTEDNKEYSHMIGAEYYMWSKDIPLNIIGQFDKSVVVNSSKLTIVQDDLLKQYRD